MIPYIYLPTVSLLRANLPHLFSFIFAYAHFISVCSSVCSRRQFSSFLPDFWFQTVFSPSRKAAADSVSDKQKTAELRAFCPFSTVLAEKEGFEPSRQSPQPTPLAGEPLTATWVLLHGLYCICKRVWRLYLAEREGFEPPVPCGITGFQDRLHKPLGHLSLFSFVIIAKSTGRVKRIRGVLGGYIPQGYGKHYL